MDSNTFQLVASGIPTQLGRNIYFGQSPKVFTAIIAGTSLSFEGCLRQIAINSVNFQFRDAKRASFATPLPTPGCTADKCNDGSAKQCSNNGYCVGNNTGLFCHCNYGYNGPNCEYCK